MDEMAEAILRDLCKPWCAYSYGFLRVKTVTELTRLSIPLLIDRSDGHRIFAGFTDFVHQLSLPHRDAELLNHVIGGCSDI